MRVIPFWYLMVLWPLAHSCSEKKTMSGTNTTSNSTSADGKVSSGTSTQTAGSASTQTASSDAETNAQVVEDDGLYTGFDGKTQFALLLPGFQTYAAADPSMLKVEQLSVSLSEATIEELLKKEAEKNTGFDQSRFKRMLQRQRKAYRITPLKAGHTTLTVTDPRGRSGGGGPGGNSGAWKKGNTVKVHITSYEASAIDTGKARYSRDGADTSRSCKSCHETGEAGAPPHELGRVMEISDQSVKQWITTGRYSNREASIPHAWSFANEAEKTGVVAFLRSKQTNDIEALTKLEIEQQIIDGGFRRPPPMQGGN